MVEENKYIVAAEVNTKYKGCIIAPADSMIMATHRIVYGPDTRQNCENWKRQNCK